MNIDILDHGYVKLIEAWGNDERIIEAACMSTDKGFEGWGPVHHSGCTATNPDTCNACTCQPKTGDEKLLKYLYDNWHHTPFEMAGMTLEIQAPIFVFREWHRHRTQSYNELSARYTPIPDVNYTPEKERLFIPGGDNKQAVGLDGKVLDNYNAVVWLNELRDLYKHAQRVYALGLELGVPKELARLPVPVARYSRMRASANLRNWIAFLTLRLDPAAQWEIRQYARAVASIVKQRYERTYALFNDRFTEDVVTRELYRACKALLDAPHPDHFASRLCDEECNALDRIKAEVAKIDKKRDARKKASV